jgi:hypothetical protein
MKALGIPDLYIAEHLGHGDTRITKDVYEHSMQHKRNETAELVNEFFEQRNKMQHASEDS